MANLTQLKMLEDLAGFVLVDKPAGIAFSSVIKAVKRKFNLVKVGHGGSLDAMASGLLILLVGDANKYVSEVMGADRAYTGSIRFDVATNTHDLFGEPVEGVVRNAFDFDRVSGLLSEFKGDVFQTESRWCSVRKEGSAGYEIVDTGEHSQFMAHVYRFNLGEPEKDGDFDRVAFSMKASKGVLVRTLVNDLGEAAGCGAVLESLRRTEVGKFSVDSAVPFDRLLEVELRDFSSLVMPLSKALI